MDCLRIGHFSVKGVSRSQRAHQDRVKPFLEKRMPLSFVKSNVNLKAAFLTLVMLSALAGTVSAQAGFGALDTVRWSTFRSGTYSKADQPTNRIINNEAEFQTYWARFHGEAPYQAPRGIEWGKELLIAIHLGERSSGGYSVYVQSIKRTRAAEITIEFVEETPAKGGANLTVITSPWTIVRMNRTAGNPVFKKRTETARRGIIVVSPCDCCSRCTCGQESGPSIGDWGRPVRLDPTHGGRYPERYVWWRELSSGEDGKMVGFTWNVLRSALELDTYWSKLSGDKRLRFDPRSIDWDREQVLALSLGRMQGPGYSVEVESVERTSPNDVLVRYVAVHPPAGPPIVTRTSSPWILIRMDRTSLTDRLTFSRRNYQPYVYTGSPCPCRCRDCRGR
jgi:hypothetical protein